MFDYRLNPWLAVRPTEVLGELRQLSFAGHVCEEESKEKGIYVQVASIIAQEWESRASEPQLGTTYGFCRMASHSDGPDI